MAFDDIKYKSKILSVHKAVTNSRFNAKTVLVNDIWDYIELWLRREKKVKALFFWQQAKHFYEATIQLPKNSSPLTAYYCMLNASKAFLLAKGKQFSNQHGVTGERNVGKVHISNEIVQFKSSGILAELCRCFNETVNNEKYTLKNLLYNLSFVHRAFDLSFSSATELYIPLKNPKIVKSRTTNEAWFCAELYGKYASMRTVKKLPSYFERDVGVEGKFIIRNTRRFKWISSKKTKSLEDYTKYHTKLRKDLFYIYSHQRLWYLKRNCEVDGYIARSNITLTFAVMHRLSELARYSPDRLAKYFDGHYNWLLSEFLSLALLQFIDELSSELTGEELMPPRLIM